MIARNEPPPPPTKSEILQPGEYAALPLAIMARKDLTAVAKLAYQAALAHLAPHAALSVPVWPSLPRLAAMVGACERSVRTAIDELEKAGLVTIERAVGKTSRYRFAPIGQEYPGKNYRGTPAKTAALPRQKLPDTPAKTTGLPRQKLPTNYLSELPKESKKTPKPPVGAKCRLPSDGEFPIEAIVAAWSAAYREAVAMPMPAKWERRIRDEPAAAELFATIDAAAIRAGRKLATDKKSPFGFGWVRNALETRAATAAAKQLGKSCPVVSSDDTADGRNAAETAKIYKAQADFRARPDREKWLAQARVHCFTPDNPDRVEMLAAAMAAKEKPHEYATC